MRTLLFMLALSAVACTSQSIKPVQTSATPLAPASAAAPPAAAPAATTPAATQYVSSTGQKLTQMQSTGDATADQQRISDAKKAGYKLVNTNGEELFCRTDPIIGSRVQKQTTCMTAKQLDDMHEQLRLGLTKLPGQASPNVLGK
jgi:hypothetical protein